MQQTILVIDDNDALRENTAEILELAGYKTLRAENGRKGVEKAMKEKPSLIVCDIMMPELDGYGVLHLLHKHEATKNIPFIFLTAKTERSDLRKGMNMGADDYITKPFEDVELLDAIEIRLKKASVFQTQYAATPGGLTRLITDAKNTGLLQNLSGQYPIQPYSKKEVLYIEGRYPRYLYYLVNGKVKAYKTHEDSKEYITDLFSTGDFIGYTSLIEDKPYDDSARLLEDAELLQIPKDEFMQLIFTDINIAAKFIHLITQNVKEKEERLMNLAYSSLRKRVAKALADVHQKFGGGTNPIEVSRDDIARYIGTATESLIRTLSDFKEEGLIEIRSGKIIITDIAKLNNLLY